MPNIVDRLEAILVYASVMEDAYMTEQATAALLELGECKRAWRETSRGKEWYKLVPIPAPEETP